MIVMCIVGIFTSLVNHYNPQVTSIGLLLSETPIVIILNHEWYKNDSKPTLYARYTCVHVIIKSSILLSLLFSQPHCNSSMIEIIEIGKEAKNRPNWLILQKMRTWQNRPISDTCKLANLNNHIPSLKGYH